MSVLLLARVSFYSVLIVISVLALIPQDHVAVTTGWDKANHWVAFFVLLMLFDTAYPSVSIWRVKLPVLLAYALMIEFIQFFVPNRHAAFLDVMADVLGMVSYLLLRPLLKNNLLRSGANS